MHAVPRGHAAGSTASLDKLVDGKASIEELDQLHEIADDIMGNTICAFGEGTAMPALGFVQKFRKDFEEHVDGKPSAPTGGRSRRMSGAP